MGYMSKEIDNIFKKLDSMNSEATMLDENALSNVDTWYDTGCYALNAILGGSCRKGGIPKGRIVGFSGESMTGKTFVVNKILANAQKQGVFPVIFDTEFAIDESSTKGVGLDASKTKYVPVYTVDQCRNQLSAFLDSVIESGQQGKFIVSIDSLGNLSSQKEIDDIAKDKSAADMGLRAKSLKSMLRTLTYKAGKAGVTILFTNHTYADPGAMFPTLVKTQSGGSGPVYMASILVQLAKRNEKEGEGDSGSLKTDKLAEANKYSGVTLRALTVKNRFVPPFLEAEMYLSFKSGLNKYSGLLQMAAARGIVEQTGSTYLVGVDCGQYKKGDKLGYAKNFVKDASFFEDFIIPELDKKLAEDYKYNGNPTVEDELEAIADEQG
jgi:RecA/RadA recombinase